jgi:predicted 3-demethylubiquinone-9 3-methyltransferase (glyoxalase superfamily)
MKAFLRTILQPTGLPFLILNEREDRFDKVNEPFLPQISCMDKNEIDSFFKSWVLHPKLRVILSILGIPPMLS